MQVIKAPRREGAGRLLSLRRGVIYFTGCEFFFLAHPCPMCLAAMSSCSPDRVVFVTTREYSSRYYIDRKYFRPLRISFDGWPGRGSQ
jgi:tRNA(Arg) A34 adenosine deaminase TadA